MNPPFSHQQDIKFYNQACNLLKNGGIISAIISENSIYEELNKIERIIYR
jgi:16S rRNA G1207 methylase RsmC